MDPFCFQQATQTGFTIRKVILHLFLRVCCQGRTRYLVLYLCVAQMAWYLVHVALPPCFMVQECRSTFVIAGWSRSMEGFQGKLKPLFKNSGVWLSPIINLL